MSATTESTYLGQKVYNPWTLKIYDLWVLGVSNSWIWNCPTKELLLFYNQYIQKKHLDVGVGTGHYLDHCQFPVANPKITLLDMNQNSLDYTAERIGRYKPVVIQADILGDAKNLNLPPKSFGSIGINYLLHCLPGSMLSKEKVLLNLKDALAPGGVIFGSTLLSQGAQVSWVGRKLMRIYNNKGIFSNREDTLKDLRHILQRNFEECHIQTQGSVAMFMARGVRT